MLPITSHEEMANILFINSYVDGIRDSCQKFHAENIFYQILFMM